MAPLSRRDLFRAVPIAAAPFLGVGRLHAEAPPQEALITRMQQPRNLETPVSRLVPPLDKKDRTLVTDADAFFVRSHFAVPKIDPKTWRLQVVGHVETPLELTLADLQNEKDQISKRLTVECAGNGRVFLVPQVRGLQWGFGGVGTADWSGIPLAKVLERAKPKPGATDVVLVGTDTGAITSDPPSPGPIPFDRGIPIDKAMKPEVILAHGMNGEPLTPSHGFPLRAVVGGWYGMASVKWLTKIIVSNKPHGGFWQTLDYSYFERRDGLAALTPLTRMQPKAIITSHTSGQVVHAAGQAITLRGLAWSGESAPASVMLSTDNGAEFAAIFAFKDNADPFAWQEWTYTWKQPKPGPVNLVVRCTDRDGRTQPDRRDPDRRTYMINHDVPVELFIK